MIDSLAPAAIDSHRLNENDAPWPKRPWIMAAICAAAGLGFHLLIDSGASTQIALWRTAAATALAVATIGFVLGAEQRRWHWALGFALIWGAVMGLIAWQAAGQNLHEPPVGWPFLSGLLAVVVATPLFQTWRDVAPDWRYGSLWLMPYGRLHDHVWADAVLGAAAVAFVGVTFLLGMLIAEMFHLIGIDLIREMFRDEWFGWLLAGSAFGGAIGLLRERDRLVATLQRLVMIVLSVLAPVLAAALLFFLLSLIGTGLGKLWSSGFSTASLMLAASAFSVLLANAVIGNGCSDRSASRTLRGAAALLAVVVLPLAVIAAVSMKLRIEQYGWTPERIWGVVAVAIALGYGMSALWAVAKGRGAFDELLRPLQQKLAIALTLLALFLALPILDFGAISTRDQLARLNTGRIPTAEFDWAAMAFDFGPDGRRALKELTQSPDKVRADAARAALAATSRYELAGPRGLVPPTPINERLRVLPEGETLPDAARARIAQSHLCGRAEQCVAVWIAEDRIGLFGQFEAGGAVQFQWVSRNEDGRWIIGPLPGTKAGSEGDVDLSKARVEIRSVQQRQIMVDGVPLSPSFD